MDFEYSNACKEVLTLFDYFLDENELSKIPKKQMEHLRKSANKDYEPTIDISKTLEEQELSLEAKAIILSLYKKYFATNEQKYAINNTITNLDRKKKANQINNSGFHSLEEVMEYKNKLKESTQNMVVENEENKEKSLIKQENFLQKIFNKILNFF